MKIEIAQKATIHRTTAERSLERALQFLRAVGTDPAIQAAMQLTGFTLADQKEGWTLVLRAYAAPATPQFTADTRPVGDAVKEIDSWQSMVFARGHAALRRLHPEQDAFVFSSITQGSGIQSVPVVAMVLDRLDALEHSPERKSSRKADHAALETLSQRGLTSASRKNARQLVKLVETSAPTVVMETPKADERTLALESVYEWVQDWSDCARNVISNRSHLIKLGIGKRRSRKVADPTPQPTPVAPQLPGAPIALLPASNGVMSGSMSVPSNGGDHA